MLSMNAAATNTVKSQERINGPPIYAFGTKQIIISPDPNYLNFTVESGLAWNENTYYTIGLNAMTEILKT